MLRSLLAKVFTVFGSAGELIVHATCFIGEIVRKAAHQIGIKVHVKRWVVEHFSAWIGRNPRYSRDVARLVASVEAFIYAAGSVILLRRLTRC